MFCYLSASVSSDLQALYRSVIIIIIINKYYLCWDWECISV